MYALVPSRTFHEGIVISSHQMGRKLPLVLALAALVAVGAWVAFARGGHAEGQRAGVWLRGAGAAGGALFALLSVVSGLAVVPAAWLGAFAGYLYGLRGGVGISPPPTLVGALVALAAA